MSDELKPCPWEKPGERHDLEMVDVGALVWVRCATCMAAVLVPLGLVCWVAMGEVRRCG